MLEPGCKAGRVSLPLAEECAFLHGLDRSEAMLELCREKIANGKLGRDRAVVEHADTTDYDPASRCGFIIPPYRAMQTLELDKQLDGPFRCIRENPWGQEPYSLRFRPRDSRRPGNTYRCFQSSPWPVSLDPLDPRTQCHTRSLAGKRHTLGTLVLPRRLCRPWAGNGPSGNSPETLLPVRSRVA